MVCVFARENMSCTMLWDRTNEIGLEGTTPQLRTQVLPWTVPLQPTDKSCEDSFAFQKIFL